MVVLGLPGHICAAVEQQRWVPWAPPPVLAGQSTPVRTSVRLPVGQQGTKKKPGSWTKTNNNVVRPDSLLVGNRPPLVWGERFLKKGK